MVDGWLSYLGMPPVEVGGHCAAAASHNAIPNGVVWVAVEPGDT
jgi:hypothetical protein